MDERTSSDRQPRLSTPDILLSQDTLDPGERSTSRPSKPSRSTQNASKNGLPRIVHNYLYSSKSETLPG